MQKRENGNGGSVVSNSTNLPALVAPPRAVRLQPVDDRSLSRKLSRFATRAGLEVVEKVLWLHYAAQQPATPFWAKSVMYGALAYFVLPFDAIPDFIPGAGFTDDLGALAAAVGTVSMYIDDEVRSRARERLRRWFKVLAIEPL